MTKKKARKIRKREKRERDVTGEKERGLPHQEDTAQTAHQNNRSPTPLNEKKIKRKRGTG